MRSTCQNRLTIVSAMHYKRYGSSIFGGTVACLSPHINGLDFWIRMSARIRAKEKIKPHQMLNPPSPTADKSHQVSAERTKAIEAQPGSNGARCRIHWLDGCRESRAWQDPQRLTWVGVNSSAILIAFSINPRDANQMRPDRKAVTPSPVTVVGGSRIAWYADIRCSPPASMVYRSRTDSPKMKK